MNAREKTRTRSIFGGPTQAYLFLCLLAFSCLRLLCLEIFLRRFFSGFPSMPLPNVLCYFFSLRTLQNKNGCAVCQMRIYIMAIL